MGGGSDQEGGGGDLAQLGKLQFCDGLESHREKYFVLPKYNFYSTNMKHKNQKQGIKTKQYQAVSCYK